MGDKLSKLKEGDKEERKSKCVKLNIIKNWKKNIKSVTKMTSFRSFR
jgi:hypothetical protein